jgi:hypothetical protein
MSQDLSGINQLHSFGIDLCIPKGLGAFGIIRTYFDLFEQLVASPEKPLELRQPGGVNARQTIPAWRGWGLGHLAPG